MITTTTNEHCIKLTADMAGAADCATACCRNNTALARLSLSVAPGCVANATGIKRVKAATWRLAGKPVRAQLAKGVVQLAMPAGFKWAAEQQLCVSIKGAARASASLFLCSSCLLAFCLGVFLCPKGFACKTPHRCVLCLVTNKHKQPHTTNPHTNTIKRTHR